MITYAERSCFQPSQLSVFRRVQEVVARVSDSWGNELRCHELARAVHRVLGDSTISVVDGHCGPVEHSWLRFSDGTILDVYVPGRLPAVQVVDAIVGAAYRPEEVRRDIRQRIVDQVVLELRGEL